MKKMMIVALIMGLCGVAQAAKFNWGLNLGQTFADSQLQNASIYFVYDLGASAAGTLGFDDSGLATMSSFTLAALGTDYAIRSGTTDAAGYFTENAWTFVPGSAIGDGNNYPPVATGSFYCVIISDDGLTMAYSTVKRNSVVTSNTVARRLSGTVLISQL